jgi:predicted nucleic acid-binding protein
VITAVDTNILLDVLLIDAPLGDVSQTALTESLRSGAVVISEAVYAELAARFLGREDIDRFLETTGIRLVPSGGEVLWLAGKAWREYTGRRQSRDVCPNCSERLRGRQHVLADFLIGAHASVHADRLLSRDRGYYRTYFPQLRVVEG